MRMQSGLDAWLVQQTTISFRRLRAEISTWIQRKGWAQKKHLLVQEMLAALNTARSESELDALFKQISDRHRGEYVPSIWQWYVSLKKEIKEGLC